MSKLYPCKWDGVLGYFRTVCGSLGINEPSDGPAGARGQGAPRGARQAGGESKSSEPVCRKMFFHADGSRCSRYEQ